MEALLKRLVDIDWCIGYELSQEQMIELDDIRTRAYEMFFEFAVKITNKEEMGENKLANTGYTIGTIEKSSN